MVLEGGFGDVAIHTGALTMWRPGPTCQLHVPDNDLMALASCRSITAGRVRTAVSPPEHHRRAARTQRCVSAACTCCRLVDASPPDAPLAAMSYGLGPGLQEPEAMRWKFAWMHASWSFKLWTCMVCYLR
jgi:hypothetical protein